MKKIDYYILRNFYFNMDVPYDNKTVGYSLRDLDYKPTYISSTLAKFVKIKYLSEPSAGIFVMDIENYKRIQFCNPELANKIKQLESDDNG